MRSRFSSGVIGTRITSPRGGDSGPGWDNPLGEGQITPGGVGLGIG